MVLQLKRLLRFLDLAASCCIVRRTMTAEQKSKLAQGLFFGLLFLFLGDFMKGCAPKYESVKDSGKFAMSMGYVIIAWGLLQCFAKSKMKP